MTKSDLELMVNECLENIIKNDIYLLDNDVHEQSLSATLACYFKLIVPNRQSGGWDVDVEYNRNMKDSKYLGSIGNVKPDIIIHRRGENNNDGTEENNLLIIEIKKMPTNSERDTDIKKIKRFIDDHPFKYKFGLFIGIYPNSIEEFKLIWFER